MKRREFIKNSTVAGIAAGTSLTFFNYSGAFAKPFLSPNFDLVAVKNGNPGAMFDKAIESMGGMATYVKPNQTVVIKPNMGWDVPPERAANTNPQLIGHIVKRCKEAGAKKIFVFDYTCDSWQKCYVNSGIEAEVKSNGGKMVPANTENYYQHSVVSKGLKLKETKEHELILESDVFINVPILKSHGGAQLSIAMKNLMGVVWDRMYYHRNDLHQCIADYASHRSPDLNVVDAYRVLKRNGPQGISENDVEEMKYLLVSSDIVAIDAAAAKVFGVNPDDVGFIKKATELGVGVSDLSTLNINRISL